MTLENEKHWDLAALASHDSDSPLWKIFDFIAEQERHFNNLQSKYRVLASAWLLASLSGIGFVIKELARATDSPYLLIAAIAAAGGTGIYLLWVVDILVYHRLLDACFVEGLKLERSVKWIPPFRHNMMRMQNDQGVLFRIVGFYLGPIVVLTLVSGGSLVLQFRNDLPNASLAIAVITSVLALAESFLIFLKTDNTAAFEDLLVDDSRTSLDRAASREAFVAAMLGFVKAAPVVIFMILVSGGILTWLAVSAKTSEGLVTVQLRDTADYLAPDRSEVRLLAQGRRGSMAHFRLPARQTSQPVAHRTVEETWYFLSGRGEMWRRLGSQEALVPVSAGTSITIPVGASFQFRSAGDEALEAVAVTMPPWPGADEAVSVRGRW
jgi:mannose-6-phosphate isomerase-like protein (cupin superfamily)